MEIDILNTITQVITTVGFPIAMCLLIFWRMNKESESHKDEIATLKDTIAENTTILAQLKQLIEDKL